MTNELSLVDIWRELNAWCKQFTWKRSQPVLQQNRLDFFLIHENLAADVIATGIEPGYRSDHSAVTITFRFAKRVRGTITFRFAKRVRGTITFRFAKEFEVKHFEI